MKMLSNIFLLSGLLIVTTTYSQDTSWSKTYNWKLYDIHNKKGFTYPADSLNFFKSTVLDDKLVQSFLGKAITWPSNKTSLWMGLYVASFETPDKQLRKIIISSYGGFLYNPLSKKYYELPQAARQSWYEYLNESLDKLNAQ